MRRIFISIIGLLLLATVGGYAQQDSCLADLDLEQLMNLDISTVLGIKQKVSRAAAVISVVSKEDIKNYGAETLSELMSYIPGFSVKDNFAKRKIITARGVAMGLYNDKILLLVNGIPMYEPITMEYYIDAIPINSVKRIEIIRGPGSTMYGTNAYSAVINIVTEDGDDMQGLNAQFIGGSWGRKEGQLQFGENVNDKISYYLAATFRDDNGYWKKDVEDENGVKQDLLYEFDNSNLYGNFKYKNATLEFGGLYQRWSKFGPIPVHMFNIDEDPENGGRTIVSEQYVNLKYHANITKKLSLKLYTHGLNYFNKTYVGKAISFYYQFIDPSLQLGQQQYIIWQGKTLISSADLNYEFNDKLNIAYTLRYDYLIRERLDANSQLLDTPIISLASVPMPNYEGILANSLLVYGNWGKFSYLAGVRYSYSSLTGVTNNLFPRVGLVYNFSKDNSIKLLYGQAYRDPSFVEWYAKVPGLIYGRALIDSNLVPEEITSYELAYRQNLFDKLMIKFNAFYLESANLIDLWPANQDERNQLLSEGLIPGTVYRNSNLRKIRGVEFEMRSTFSDKIGLWGNISYKEGKIIDENTDTIMYNYLPFVEKFTANAGFHVVMWDRLTIAPNMQYVGDRSGYITVKNDQGQMVEKWNDVPAYTLYNINIWCRTTQKLKLGLSIHNILNTTYYYPEDIRKHIKTIPGGPGRSIYVKLSYQIQ